jgi:hypothetical protein
MTQVFLIIFITGPAWPSQVLIIIIAVRTTVEKLHDSSIQMYAPEN